MSSGILLSHNKEGNVATCHSEVSQLEKEKCYITSKWNLKNNTNGSIYQKKTKLSMYLLISLTILPAVWSSPSSYT